MYYIIKLNFQLLSPNKYPIYCNICAKLAKFHPVFKPFHRRTKVAKNHFRACETRVGALQRKLQILFL